MDSTDKNDGYIQVFLIDIRGWLLNIWRIINLKGFINLINVRMLLSELQVVRIVSEKYKDTYYSYVISFSLPVRFSFWFS